MAVYIASKKQKTKATTRNNWKTLCDVSSYFMLTMEEFKHLNKAPLLKLLIIILGRNPFRHVMLFSDLKASFHRFHSVVS